MCSIAGIVQTALDDAASAAAVGRMTQALHHRGPDDVGQVTISSNHSPSYKVILGNTRLAIIDITAAGHQPMHDAQTGNWITYNGETYNYRQLRREIGDEFGTWHSNTDTEVVLRAYRKWGTTALEKLQGMFALAIWDDHKQELILARDSFGIKPLYYYVDAGKTLIFASEVRALLASELVPRRLSPFAVNSYLEFGSVQAPLTIVENVCSLMPGQILTVRLNKSAELELEMSSYRRQVDPARPTSRDEAKVQLRNILEASVQQHLVSDVPIGVFLSGGMDSSAIVGLMSRVSDEPPKTFSVVFSEKQFDEASHSRLIAETFRTDHCEVKLTEESLLDSLPQAIAALDQPSMDGINTYVVSKAVKEAGVTVALSGLGGDELFGGYPSFRRAQKFESVNKLAKGFLKAAAPLGHAIGNGSTQRNKFWQLAASDGSARSVCRITRQLFAPGSVEKLSGSRNITESSDLSGQQVAKRSVNDEDTFNVISRLELEGYMANTLLRDTDTMSMASSLEVRVPFVDSEVAGFVLSLPGQWKSMANGYATPKPLLAEVLSDLLPRDILNRKKMGFTLPFEKWMTSELRGEVSDTIENLDCVSAAGIDQHFANQVWRSFLRTPKAVGWSRPWALFVLAKWCQINGVSNTSR